MSGILTAGSTGRRGHAGTYAAKVFVQQLHVSVDDLQSDELIVLVLYGAAEVQAGIPATQWQTSQLGVFIGNTATAN